MFIHYYRYKTRYLSQTILADKRLVIQYPSPEHSMITTGHDFYVIGSFHGMEISSSAKLQVTLTSLESGNIVRCVKTGTKNNRQGMFVEYEGIETKEEEATVRNSGMPDLVYNPLEPSSFWYTWNKAYYSDRVFSALIYGGSCRMEKIYPYDQYGCRLKPLEEGIYELRVTLDNEGEKIVSARTIWITQGQKEIILSRFSPKVHLERIEQFAAEEGFEEFTDPFAGIWDTNYFSFEWPVKAWIEIPKRWHFGDAQEYRSGRVHFFNYNISEDCVSYKTEIGAMLAVDRQCVDDPDRLVTYYYESGEPEADAGAGNKLCRILPGKYFALTKKRMYLEKEKYVLEIQAVCKPLPSDTAEISDCAYRIKNRIESVDYYLYKNGEKNAFLSLKGYRAGIMHTSLEGMEEFLPLHIHHRLELDEYSLGEKIQIKMEVRDCRGEVRDSECFDLSTIS